MISKNAAFQQPRPFFEQSNQLLECLAGRWQHRTHNIILMYIFFESGVCSIYCLLRNEIKNLFIDARFVVFLHTILFDLNF